MKATIEVAYIFFCCYYTVSCRTYKIKASGRLFCHKNLAATIGIPVRLMDEDGKPAVFVI